MALMSSPPATSIKEMEITENVTDNDAIDDEMIQDDVSEEVPAPA